MYFTKVDYNFSVAYAYAKNTLNYQNIIEINFVGLWLRASGANSEILIISFVCRWYVGSPKFGHIYNK